MSSGLSPANIAGDCASIALIIASCSGRPGSSSARAKARATSMSTSGAMLLFRRLSSTSLCTAAIVWSAPTSLPRLHPQRSEGTLEHKGVGVDHAIARAIALRLSKQLPDNFRSGTRLRQYRASGQRVLTWLGAGVQLPANLLRDLDDGGLRYHSRLLPL